MPEYIQYFRGNPIAPHNTIPGTVTNPLKSYGAPANPDSLKRAIPASKLNNKNRPSIADLNRQALREMERKKQEQSLNSQPQPKYQWGNKTY